MNRVSLNFRELLSKQGSSDDELMHVHAATDHNLDPLRGWDEFIEFCESHKIKPPE